MNNKVYWIIGAALILIAVILSFASSRIDFLKGEIALREQLIERQEARTDSLSALLPDLRKDIAGSSLLIEELQASRSWWFHRSLESDAKIEDILKSTFTGPDSLLAHAIYMEWRISTGRDTE